MDFVSTKSRKMRFIFPQIINSMSVGERIKQVREYNKLKSSAFAKELDLDRSYYAKIESGKLFPTIHCLQNISRKYGVSVDWILDGDGEMLKVDRMRSFEPQTIEDAKSLQWGYICDRYEKLAKENGVLSQTVEFLSTDKEHLVKQIAQLTAEKHELSSTIKLLTAKNGRYENLLRENRKLTEKVGSLTKEVELEKNSNWGKEPHPSFLPLAGLDDREEVEVLARTDGVLV
jgi:transcriptional regulator with XRE-family HTH domain